MGGWADGRMGRVAMDMLDQEAISEAVFNIV